MTDIERRAFTAEVRATGDGNTVEFRPIVFNQRSQNLGGFQEIIEPGSVTKTLADGRNIAADFMHSDVALLGSTAAKTLRLRTDARGVIATVDLPDTSIGRDVRTLVHRGDVAGASFKFLAVKDHWDERGAVPTRHVDEMQLFAVSLVSSPAYLGTVGTVSARALSVARTYHLGARHPTATTPREMRERLAELARGYDYTRDVPFAPPPIWVTSHIER